MLHWVHRISKTHVKSNSSAAVTCPCDTTSLALGIATGSTFYVVRGLFWPWLCASRMRLWLRVAGAGPMCLRQLSSSGGRSEQKMLSRRRAVAVLIAEALTAGAAMMAAAALTMILDLATTLIIPDHSDAACCIESCGNSAQEVQ